MHLNNILAAVVSVTKGWAYLIWHSLLWLFVIWNLWDVKYSQEVLWWQFSINVYFIWASFFKLLLCDDNDNNSIYYLIDRMTSRHRQLANRLLFNIFPHCHSYTSSAFQPALIKLYCTWAFALMCNHNVFSCISAVNLKSIWI